MKAVAAYLLAVLGGNDHPNANDVKKILKSVGADVDNETLSKLFSELEGKNVFEVMEQGRSKLAAVPSGGGVATSAGAGAAPSAGAAAESKKVEEEKKESSSESEEGGFGGLFG